MMRPIDPVAIVTLKQSPLRRLCRAGAPVECEFIV